MGQRCRPPPPPSFPPRLLYLDTEVAAVDVIPEEQVPCGGRRSSHFKELHQIKELPVDVATDWKTTSRGCRVQKGRLRTPACKKERCTFTKQPGQFSSQNYDFKLFLQNFKCRCVTSVYVYLWFYHFLERGLMA